MADDDGPKAPVTIESLFQQYANLQTDMSVNKDLVFDKILLSQIDQWLIKAKIIKNLATTTDTGMIYLTFKKWRLDYEDFLVFIKKLCIRNSLNLNAITEMLLIAGPPVLIDSNVIVK